VKPASSRRSFCFPHCVSVVVIAVPFPVFLSEDLSAEPLRGGEAGQSRRSRARAAYAARDTCVGGMD
jgi:hypothetical protein